MSRPVEEEIGRALGGVLGIVLRCMVIGLVSWLVLPELWDGAPDGYWYHVGAVWCLMALIKAGRGGQRGAP